VKQLLFIVKRWIKKKFVHCFLAKRNAVEAKTWLDKHNLDLAPAKSTVEEWFAKLKRVEMCIEGDARSGLPKEAVSDENIKKVHNIILNDRKVKWIEIAETLKISKDHVRHIVHEHLDIRKLCRACSQSFKSNNVLMIQSNV
jgi:hypothetical protein